MKRNKGIGRLLNVLLLLTAAVLVLERAYTAYRKYLNRYVCIERFDLDE